MNFFSGGFVQLISDLNEPQLDEGITDKYAFENCSRPEDHWQLWKMNAERPNDCGTQPHEDQRDIFCNYDYAATVSLATAFEPEAESHTWNTLATYKVENLNSLQNDVFRQAEDLDFIFIDETEQTVGTQQSLSEAVQATKGVNASAQIAREMADWEYTFLDNYVEIPELVEFLPEKTPFCTELCELFLEESSVNLQLHHKRKTQQLDADSKSYPCTYGDCKKIYAKPAHLKAHLRRHLGEKPYVCTWPDCSWRFSRSDELARHRRSHSGIKPYKCDYCIKCFARSDHLTKHRKVHERRMLAASKAGKALDGCIFTVRPGRKRKNQIC